MQIWVNGQVRTAPEGLTVDALLQELDIRSEHVAVEVNLDIVDRREFGRRALLDGDRVEILSFIGGGSDLSSSPCTRRA